MGKSLEGKRIEMIETGNVEPRLSKGEKGTIREVDGEGTIHVEWDNGCRLGVIPKFDKFKIID